MNFFDWLFNRKKKGVQVNTAISAQAFPVKQITTAKAVQPKSNAATTASNTTNKVGTKGKPVLKKRPKTIVRKSRTAQPISTSAKTGVKSLTTAATSKDVKKISAKKRLNVIGKKKRGAKKTVSAKGKMLKVIGQKKTATKPRISKKKGFFKKAGKTARFTPAGASLRLAKKGLKKFSLKKKTGVKNAGKKVIKTPKMTALRKAGSSPLKAVRKAKSSPIKTIRTAVPKVAKTQKSPVRAIRTAVPKFAKAQSSPVKAIRTAASSVRTTPIQRIAPRVNVVKSNPILTPVKPLNLSVSKPKVVVNRPTARIITRKRR